MVNHSNQSIANSKTNGFHDFAKLKIRPDQIKTLCKPLVIYFHTLSTFVQRQMSDSEWLINYAYQ